MYRPFVTVVVRSYKRPGPLLQLVECLRAQCYERFEVLICEQSEDPELVKCLLAILDPRIRLMVTPPLGCTGARNQGVLHAKGEIVIFIDDDDLPVRNDWIQCHVDNFRDPNCQGVSGRLADSMADADRLRTSARARNKVMTTTFWKDTKCFSWLGERKKGIDTLFGTNCSLRKSLCGRIGGWDEDFRYGEEHSFFFRWHKSKMPKEYFVHDPKPVIWRRTDVEGGCERRVRGCWYLREFDARVKAYFRVVAYYYPVRFWLLLPLFLVRMVVQMWQWIFDEDNRGQRLPVRLLACLLVLVQLPVAVVRHGMLRVGKPIKRMPVLRASE